jgi:hypothetical protein
MPTVSRTASPSRRRLQYLPAAQLHSSARPKIPVRQAASHIEVAETLPSSISLRTSSTPKLRHRSFFLSQQHGLVASVLAMIRDLAKPHDRKADDQVSHPCRLMSLCTTMRALGNRGFHPQSFSSAWLSVNFILLLPLFSLHGATALGCWTGLSRTSPRGLDARAKHSRECRPT